MGEDISQHPRQGGTVVNRKHTIGLDCLVFGCLNVDCADFGHFSASVESFYASLILRMVVNWLSASAS